ncbi:MAG: hypothetical protein SF053_08760 [Bacteroidia bacterium]|nr:hypothetical protein [Bacteroidia bacterium]
MWEKIETYIRQHRLQLDTEQPGPEVWARVAREMGGQAPVADLRRYTFMKVAVVVLMCMTGGYAAYLFGPALGASLRPVRRQQPPQAWTAQYEACVSQHQDEATVVDPALAAEWKKIHSIRLELEKELQRMGYTERRGDALLQACEAEKRFLTPAQP